MFFYNGRKQNAAFHVFSWKAFRLRLPIGVLQQLCVYRVSGRDIGRKSQGFLPTCIKISLVHGLHVRISITRIRSVLRESEWLSYVFSRFDTEHESDRRKDGQNYDSKCHALQQRRAVKTVEQEKLKKGRTAHEISRIHFHITLATFSGKRNVMAWRPSVRLSVPSAYLPW